MGKVMDAIRGAGITLDQQKSAKMAALDLEYDQMESKVKRLEAQILKLEAQVNPLQREVDGLQKRIQESSAKPVATTVELEKVKEEMLRVLNKHPRASTDSIAKAFDMTGDGVKFHLEAMRKEKMIESGYDDEEIWWLEQAGREYLHKKGWLK